MSVDDLDSTTTRTHSKHAFVSKCEGSKVTAFIQKYVLTAYLKSENRRELHYILPYEEARKGNFEKLFDALESGQEELYISSFGVADSTLEEVFLEVTENATKELEGGLAFYILIVLILILPLLVWTNPAMPKHNIYILSVVALDETNISGCLHFSMQNIEMPCDLDRASRRSNFNVS